MSNPKNLFRLAVPRAGRALDWSTELEGVIFGTSSPDLEHLLIVPVQPEIKASSAAAAAAAVTTTATMTTTTTTTTTTAATAAVAMTATTNKTSVTFFSLPLDIHWLIFDHLSDSADLTCLGLAYPDLWATAQSIVPRRYASQLGHWAGEQVVCAGVCVPNHYPPAMYSTNTRMMINGNQEFTLDGVKIRRHHTLQADGTAVYVGLAVNVYEPGIEGEVAVPIALHNLCERPNVRYEEDVTIAEKSRRVYEECIRRCEGPSEVACIRKRRKEIVTKHSPFIPKDQEWMLRNLTTREFVTAKGIALDEKYIDGPFIRGIGFGEVVMLRVCWSTFAKPGVVYTHHVGMGVWAGHRFEITTRKRHEERSRDQAGWRDVSVGVAAEIAAVWEMEYGKDWRKMASKIVAI
ncbi:hypothetical protein VE03_05100 [Pseudogymnoascus sp. 23342-1-I1]|nr:hypothetical protein VE03_05100 [Pseudogymnoascus sp. 23342-1-I1]